MQKRHKDLLRALVSGLRTKLVGRTSVSEETVERGNLDRELERLGISPDGTIKPIEALPGVREHELYAYHVAADQLVPLSISQRVILRSEIVERAAYTWINRLLALRAMEVRGLIDNTLRGEEAYGGISEKLFLVRETQPERANGEDGGWWAVIEEACREQAAPLPGLFALDDPVAALRPSASVLAQCIALVGGNLANFTQDECDAALADPDAIGWAYQFYQEESKGNIDAKCKSGGKVVNRSELAAKTQLFTEPYMVQWLLQNSLGRSYHEAYPQSTLPAQWPYYVQPEQLATDSYFTLASLTLLDPCMGSGHFLRAAFDLFVAMYREQFPTWSARAIADRILSQHLHGIDLDPRAAQLTALTLYLRAWELVRDEQRAQRLPSASSYTPPALNLATTPTNLNKGALERHLKRHPQDKLFLSLIEEIFAGLEQAEILGSLLRPREYLDRAIAELEKLPSIQRDLFADAHDDELRIKIAVMAKEEPAELKKMALNHIIESFHAEAHNVNDISAMLFGREAEQGVRLLQLLDRQYAVVATNPPYMGSKYMNASLRKYVEDNYKPGKRDLYAAFILRCLELCQPKGRVAMVTMQGWMFMRSFADFRALSEDKVASKQKIDSFTGILRNAIIETLAHLGANAFEEIKGEVVKSAMFILVNRIVNIEHKMIALRLIGLKSANEKKAVLLKKNQEEFDKACIFSNQNNFLSIYEFPIVYYLSDELLILLKYNRKLQDIAYVRQGLATADNARFTRCIWECREGYRWRPYVKGGGYSKWIGLEWLLVDWQINGVRIHLWGKGVLRATEFYFKQGLTYTPISGGALGLRRLENSAFDVKGSSLFLKDERQDLLKLAICLSSHVCSYLTRAISQSLELHVGYLSQVPIPDDINVFSDLGSLVEKLKISIISTNLSERCFKATVTNRHELLITAMLHSVEGVLEREVCQIYKLTSSTIRTIVEDTGTPAG